MKDSRLPVVLVSRSCRRPLVAEPVGQRASRGPFLRLMGVGLLALLAGCGRQRSNPQYAVVEWVLSTPGGQLEVDVSGERTIVRSLDDLPAGEWQVRKVWWDVYPGDEMTSVGDDDLGRLATLGGLESLDLWKAPVGDQGLTHLSALNALVQLNLNETQVTDAGLVHLQGLANLRNLELTDTQVTPTGLAALQAALPNCRIRGPGAAATGS